MKTVSKRGRKEKIEYYGTILFSKGRKYKRIKLPLTDVLSCMSSHKEKSHCWVLEHRYVLAKKLGRPLTDEEHVHHLDGDGSNNDPDNLVLIESTQHKLIHFENCQLKRKINKLENILKENGIRY